MIPGSLKHPDGLLVPAIGAPFLSESFRMVLLRIANNPAVLVRKVKGKPGFVPKRHHHVGRSGNLTLGQLQGFAPGSHGLGTVCSSQCLQHLVTKRLPSLMGKLVSLVLLKLNVAERSHPGPQLCRQLDNDIDIAVLAEVGVVLVGALEEDVIHSLLGPTFIAS